MSMKRTGIVILTAASITLAGCAGTDENTAKRTIGGAGVGALSGLAIGAIVGSPGTGAAVGAVAGATGGLIYDQISKDKGGS
jgi:uncharacterized membrane protein